MAEWLWRVAQDILNIFLVETSVRLLIGKPAGVRIPFLSSNFFLILSHTILGLVALTAEATIRVKRASGLY
jgi:hypothetical protein